MDDFKKLLQEIKNRIDESSEYKKKLEQNQKELSESKIKIENLEKELEKVRLQGLISELEEYR